MRLFQVLAVFFCALGTIEAHQALRMLLQRRSAATMECGAASALLLSIGLCFAVIGRF